MELFKEDNEKIKIDNDIHNENYKISYKKIVNRTLDALCTITYGESLQNNEW